MTTSMLILGTAVVLMVVAAAVLVASAKSRMHVAVGIALLLLSVVTFVIGQKEEVRQRGDCLEWVGGFFRPQCVEWEWPHSEDTP
jgi:cell division protein FtsW (lipid II flippase)